MHLYLNQDLNTKRKKSAHPSLKADANLIGDSEVGHLELDPGAHILLLRWRRVLHGGETARPTRRASGLGPRRDLPGGAPRSPAPQRWRSDQEPRRRGLAEEAGPAEAPRVAAIHHRVEGRDPAKGHQRGWNSGEGNPRREEGRWPGVEERNGKRRRGLRVVIGDPTVYIGRGRGRGARTLRVGKKRRVVSMSSPRAHLISPSLAEISVLARFGQLNRGQLEGQDSGPAPPAPGNRGKWWTGVSWTARSRNSPSSVMGRMMRNPGSRRGCSLTHVAIKHGGPEDEWAQDLT